MWVPLPQPSLRNKPRGCWLRPHPRPTQSTNTLANVSKNGPRLSHRAGGAPGGKPHCPETERAEPGPQGICIVDGREGAQLGQLAGKVPDHPLPTSWAPLPPGGQARAMAGPECPGTQAASQRPAWRRGSHGREGPGTAPQSPALWEVGCAGQPGTRSLAQDLVPPSPQLRPHGPSWPILPPNLCPCCAQNRGCPLHGQPAHSASWRPRETPHTRGLWSHRPAD